MQEYLISFFLGVGLSRLIFGTAMGHWWDPFYWEALSAEFVVQMLDGFCLLCLILGTLGLVGII